MGRLASLPVNPLVNRSESTIASLFLQLKFLIVFPLVIQAKGNRFEIVIP